ncbi:hypothetical protein SO694_00022056 [Aureococcus anophagefferens]|uniref:Uncharacterized protein n=1 Tax=Aureococcus anophagefferens TaxID=44056 RepID=A0ABR1FTD3_AURAN
MAADKPAADADTPDATHKADALAAAVAKEVRANAPAIEDCFRAELARTRGNASFGEGDLAGALRDWTEAVRLSGDLPGAAAESKARALGNLSMLKLSYFADVRGAVDDAAASAEADPTYAKAYARHAAALRCALGDGAPEILRAFQAADAVRLPPREEKVLKRQRLECKHRRKAYEAQVTELAERPVAPGGAPLDAHIAAKLDEHAARRLRAVGEPSARASPRPPAAVLACLDWRRAAPPRVLDAAARAALAADAVALRGTLAFPVDAALGACGSRLTSLRLDDVSAPDGFWRAALRGCPLLYAVDAKPVRGADELCEALGKECGLLRDLELRAAFGVDVAAGKALAAGCPNLRRVAVRGGPTVDNYALEPLLRKCLRLEALALADCSAVDDELLLDVADVAADLPLALADLSLHRTSCTRAGVDALRDALAKDEHNTALRIDFDGPPADDAPPPVESPLT